MTRNPTLLVYGAGRNQLPVIEAGKRRGWRVVAIDRDEHAPGIRLADRFVCSSIRDHETISRAVASEALCGVVARVTDPGALESSRRISDGYGLSGPESTLVAAATSKQALAAFCRDAGLATPRRYSDRDLEDGLREPQRSMPRFVCVRPDVTIRGKAAIRRVEVGGPIPTGLPSAVGAGSESARLKSGGAFTVARAEAEAASENGRVDVAEWIEGADVSVLAEIDRGRARRIAVFDEWVAVRGDGRIAGIGAGMPSIFEHAPTAIDAALADLARACAASRCLVTLSLRLDSSGRAHVIEIHLGVGGDAIADLLLPAALPGFDAFDALVAVGAGLPVKAPRSGARACGLLRAGAQWRLVEARDARALRAVVRATLPVGCSIPAALDESWGG